MAIKYTLENLEGVDDTIKPLYKEAETGGFVLDVEGAVSQSQFNEINQKSVDNATEAQRRRKTVERVVAKMGLETADGLDDAIDALMAAKAGSGKANEDQEAIIAQLKTAHETQLQEVRGQITGMKLDAAQSSFQAALQEAGFPAKAASMFAAANMARVKLDESGDLRIMSEKGTPLAGSGADGFATLGDLSNELAAAMPEFLVDKGKGGGGKAPATGVGNGIPNGKFGSLAAKVPGFSQLPES